MTCFRLMLSDSKKINEMNMYKCLWRFWVPSMFGGSSRCTSLRNERMNAGAELIL